MYINKSLWKMRNFFGSETYIWSCLSVRLGRSVGLSVIINSEKRARGFIQCSYRSTCLGNNCRPTYITKIGNIWSTRSTKRFHVPKSNHCEGKGGGLAFFLLGEIFHPIEGAWSLFVCQQDKRASDQRFYLTIGERGHIRQTKLSMEQLNTKNETV